MVSPNAFLSNLQSAGVEFVVGVPDSLLKNFCSHIDATLDAAKHLIAANEGTAIAIAAGHHLATGCTPFVYLQNSGLGNAINPLLSLVDQEVYGIPIALMIGWRGEPDVKDEPQHIKQGRVTPALLDAMEIPFRKLGRDAAESADDARWVVNEAMGRRGPAALLVSKGAFSSATDRDAGSRTQRYSLTRERAIECVLDGLPADATIVSTTGKISRELYESRRRRSEGKGGDFLTVGSMGHASQIALGIAMARPDEVTVCLDGDGAAIMHMGGMATIGTVRPRRFIHVVLNNGAHESVGGQPTVGFDIDLCEIGKACGYRNVFEPLTKDADVRAAIARALDVDGPCLIEVRVALGSRPDLGRPRETPAENKALFVERLRRVLRTS